MRQIAFVVLVLAALVACGRNQPKTPPAPAGERVQPFDLHIEIGRYGYMLSQVHGIANPDGEAPATDSPEEPRALARALRETVWEYNIERSRLCARNVVAAASCGPSYNPVWLADPADAEVSLPELQTRANAVGGEIMPFWNAVCDDARSRVTDEEEKRLVCAIE